MNSIPGKNQAYEMLLEDLEETILVWQKKVKAESNDKRFNARKFLADKLDYKDEKILYRFCDVNDSSKIKLGVIDLQKILEIIGDIKPLENYLEALKEKND